MNKSLLFASFFLLSTTLHGMDNASDGRSTSALRMFESSCDGQHYLESRPTTPNRSRAASPCCDQSPGLSNQFSSLAVVSQLRTPEKNRRTSSGNAFDMDIISSDTLIATPEFQRRKVDEWSPEMKAIYNGTKIEVRRKEVIHNGTKIEVRRKKLKAKIKRPCPGALFKEVVAINDADSNAISMKPSEFDSWLN